MPTPDLMTVQELAEFLRVGRATIYRLLRQEKLPGFRVGAEWHFDRAVIERWLREAEHSTSVRKRRRS